MTVISLMQGKIDHIVASVSVSMRFQHVNPRSTKPLLVLEPLAWCRAELWCHLLSNKPFTDVIVVFSAKEAQFMYPSDWQDRAFRPFSMPPRLLECVFS